MRTKRESAKRGNSPAHPDPGTLISRSCTATASTLRCRAHNTHTPPWPPSLAPPSTPPKMLCAGQLRLQPVRPAGARSAAVRAVATPLAQKPWPLPCLPCPGTCMHDSLHDPAPRPPCPAPSRPPAAPPLRCAAAPRCRRLRFSIAAARRTAVATAAAHRAARGQPAAPTHRTRWCPMAPSRASAQRPAASSGRCVARGERCCFAAVLALRPAGALRCCQRGCSPVCGRAGRAGMRSAEERACAGMQGGALQG